MKKSILILALLAAATLLAVRFAAPTASPPPTPTALEPAGATTPPEVHVAKASPPAVMPPPAAKLPASKSKATSTVGVPAGADDIVFAAAIDTLISPKSSYAEKQATFKQLLASGRIQDVMAELEQRAAGDPNNPDIAAALGQAYLKACTTTDDVRSKAVWAMQADRSFDTALSLDPSNWDARYTKAVAMSYWPADLNKGAEVVNQFNTLIGQQEKETPQPQFAQSYDWLGRQYEKMGQPDLAQQVWARGAALFPDNETLRGRLASK